MFEQARFSLPRAGVMTGLCCALLLGVGAFVQIRGEPVLQRERHFNEPTWRGVQAVLRQVRPEADRSAPFSPPVPAAAPACVPGSPRHAEVSAAVERLDAALAALSGSQFVRQRYRLDLAALLADPALKSLPCARVLEPLRWLQQQLQRQGPAFLEALTWKERLAGSSPQRLLGNAWVALPPNMLSAVSPWAGQPGCLLWSDAATGQRLVVERPGDASQRLCLAQADALGARRVPASIAAVPPGLAQWVEPLAPWRSPQHPQFLQRVGDNPAPALAGMSARTVGLHAQLAVDPRWQARLQEVVDCFTGAGGPACEAYALQAQGRYEQARVRMAGVAVVDVATGRLVAAASGDSPCHRHDRTRLGPRPPGCPELPEGTAHRPRLPRSPDNHALFTQAAPGSLAKPLLMAGILQDARAGNSISGLDDALPRSDSPRFLDAFLCRRQLGKGDFAEACERPAFTQQAAHRLGWNAGCDERAEASMARCGLGDLLLGGTVSSTRADAQPRLPVLMGQILVRARPLPGGVWGYQDLPWPASLPTPQERRDCASTGAAGYVRCGGARLAVVSEAYGQGNALATPVGVAGLFAGLASSAASQPLQAPRLLVDLLRADGRREVLPGANPAGPPGIAAPTTRRVIAAMERTHRPGGTAHAACVRAFGALACSGELGMAGKTGTPGDADDRSPARLVQDMRDRAQCQQRQEARCAERFPLPRLRHRWYAALVRSPGSADYDKAIAVLVHSNWNRASGRFDDDLNPAAELAMQAVRRLREPMP